MCYVEPNSLTVIFIMLLLLLLSIYSRGLESVELYLYTPPLTCLCGLSRDKCTLFAVHFPVDIMLSSPSSSSSYISLRFFVLLTLILLTWRIGWAPNNPSKWQMGFNSAFKGLNFHPVPRLRISGALPLLPPHAFVAWARTNIIFLPYIFLLISSSISFRFFILLNVYTNKHKDCFTPSKHIQAGGVRQNRNYK